MATGNEPQEQPAERQAASPAAAEEAGPPRGRGRGRGGGNMLPGRDRRRFGIERLLMRLIATAGIVGIGVAVGAILADNKVEGWIIGLAISLMAVILSGLLWSSRQL
jgi:hypothetical protein